jgi:hypothetical protein
MRVQKSRSTVFTPLDDGTAVLLSLDTLLYYSLNQTAAAVWRQLEGNNWVTLDELVAATCDSFEVDEETASQYLGPFLNRLRDLSLVELVEP